MIEIQEIILFCKNHIFLCSSALVIVTLLLVEEFRTRFEGNIFADVDIVIDYINHKEAVIIDIRTQEEYKSGHIIHSININIESKTDPKSIEKKILKYRNRNIVFIDKDGSTLLNIHKKLKSIDGFSNAILLKGGIDNWIKNNLVVEKL